MFLSEIYDPYPSEDDKHACIAWVERRQLLSDIIHSFYQMDESQRLVLRHLAEKLRLQSALENPPTVVRRTENYIGDE